MISEIQRELYNFTDIKDLNKQGDKLIPEIERLNTVKTSVLSKLFYRLNVIPIKTSMSLIWTSMN